MRQDRSNVAARSVRLGAPVGLLAVAMAFAPVASAQCLDDDAPWGDRLGYGDGTVLIVHADDAGAFVGGNSAIADMLESGVIDSASVMVPPPYYGEMVARHNQAGGLGVEYDLGIHLTLNSRKNYRWGPVHDPARKVKRILKRKFLFWGWHPYFPTGAFYSWFYRGPQAVDWELRAQINAALVGWPAHDGFPAVPMMDPPPTHVDSHAGAVFVRKSHFKRYLWVAKHLGVPALTFENWDFTAACMARVDEDDPLVRLAGWLSDRQRRAQQDFPDWPYPRLDQYCGVVYGTDLQTTRDQMADLISTLPSGITQIYLHPADEDPLLRSILTPRDADKRILIDRHLFDTGTGDDLDQELAGVERTNWRKMMQRFAQAQAGNLCTDPGDGQHWDPPSCCTPPP